MKNYETPAGPLEEELADNDDIKAIRIACEGIHFWIRMFGVSSLMFCIVLILLMISHW